MSVQKDTPCCKYCFKPGYDWCCPECFKQFEADDAYGEDEEEDEEEEDNEED